MIPRNSIAMGPALAGISMLDCLLVGDSIAVGLHTLMRECRTCARGGYNSWQVNRLCARELSADTVVISLATNDWWGIKTLQELEAIRGRVKAQRVFWILPWANLPASRVPIETIQQIVCQVAAANGDVVVSTPLREPGLGIHPSWAGYRALKESIAQ